MRQSTKQQHADTSFPLPDEIIDLTLGAKLIDGSQAKAKEMIQMLIDSLPSELTTLQTAYQQRNWKTIQGVVHKLRGGTSYCGMPRLKAACLNLGTSLKGNNVELRIALYEQLIAEITAVKNTFAK